MADGLPHGVIGYGVTVMEKVRPLRAPQAYDHPQEQKRAQHCGADISTPMRMSHAGSFDSVPTHFCEYPLF